MPRAYLLLDLAQGPTAPIVRGFFFLFFFCHDGRGNWGVLIGGVTYPLASRCHFSECRSRSDSRRGETVGEMSRGNVAGTMAPAIQKEQRQKSTFTLPPPSPEAAAIFLSQHFHKHAGLCFALEQKSKHKSHSPLKQYPRSWRNLSYGIG